MKILLLGAGAKDHALAYFLSQSKRITGLFVAPGNFGTKSIAINLNDVDIEDKESVYNACKKYKIDGVVIGTESPLQKGVIDYLNEKNIKTLGTLEKAVKLDGDREFSRAFCQKYSINIPESKIFKNNKELEKYLDLHKNEHFVIKKKNMSPSRIMIDSKDKEKLLEFAKPLFKDGPIILEKHLKGISATLSVFIDGKNYLKLPLASEYNKTHEDGKGSATGGMGSICPFPVKKEINKIIDEKIVKPTLYGLKKENLMYKGVITFSMVITKKEPILVDYHVRFNDPATQSIIPLIKNDALDIFEAIRNQELDKIKIETKNYTSVAVVVASKGYPNNPVIDQEVNINNSTYKNFTVYDNCYIFFGAVKEENGRLLTSGGRNITVVGIGDTIEMANKRAYKVIKEINIKDSWYRKDIGNKFFED